MRNITLKDGNTNIFFPFIISLMFTFCVKTNDEGNLLGHAIMVYFILNWYKRNPFFTTKNDIHSKDIDFYLLLHQGQRWIINEYRSKTIYMESKI